VISWQVPAQRTDGTALASAELATFDILYFDDATGTMRTVKITDSLQRTAQITSLTRGTTYHFSIIVTDTLGNASAASQSVDLPL
jgi:hypothetical protein